MDKKVVKHQTPNSMKNLEPGTSVTVFFPKNDTLSEKYPEGIVGIIQESSDDGSVVNAYVLGQDGISRLLTGIKADIADNDISSARFEPIKLK